MSGLGRGLGSLIPQKINKTVTNDFSHSASDSNSLVGINTNDAILKISPELIKVNPRQPRQDFDEQALTELVDSIKEYGVIQPLLVNKVGDSYELIAGERRLRASKLAGLDKVPVIVRQVDDQEKLELALIENIQREDLNPVELATAYKQLAADFNLNQEELAQKLGKPRSTVANVIRILSLPEIIKTALADGKITEGHAKILSGLESEDKQMSLFRKILASNLTIANTINESRVLGGTKNAKVKINYADKDKEFYLREFFGTKVEIKRKKIGGQIIVDFFSDDELDEMIGKVKK